MGSQKTKSVLGEGERLRRFIATMIGFGPLVIFAYALQIYSQKTWPLWGQLTLFVATLLVSSFAYDAIKKFLTLPKDKFLAVWKNVRNLSLFLGAYVLAIVVLALIPSHNLGWFDSFVGIAFFIFGLASSISAMTYFIKAVTLSAE